MDAGGRAAPGRLSCCAGYGEHFDWCATGRELRRLHQQMMRRGVIRTAAVEREPLDVWRARVAADLDAADEADRAWVAWTEADA